MNWRSRFSLSASASVSNRSYVWVSAPLKYSRVWRIDVTMIQSQVRLMAYW